MSKNFIIGIDLGGTNLKVALLDLRWRIKYKAIFKTQSFSPKERLISAITHAVEQTIQKHHISNRNILGIGLGLPGPIDPQKGLVHFLPNIPGWNEVYLKTILEKRLKLPVFIDNDAKIMCLAEYKIGAARGFKNALCVTLGTGVGGGLILQGQLYRGEKNAAGEIGHLPINEKGRRCNCGGIGCLEAYVGNNRIKQEAKKIFKRNITLEELSILAKQNNKRAVKLWRSVASRLGVAFAGMANVLNLDAIVIGGGVANAGEFLFTSVRKAIKERAMCVQAEHIKVLKARLGSDAGLIGAAVLVKEGLGK
jgi:glucokinase